MTNHLCPVQMVRHAGITVIYSRESGALKAHEFGSIRPAPLTPELVAAIEAEERRQQQKRHNGGDPA